MLYACAALFAAIGLLLIVQRRPLAELQAMLAGGTMLPGCVVAEGIFFLLLAAAVIVAFRMGFLRL